MAPLWQAINVKLSAQTDTQWIYEGTVDATWTVGSVPNGGYIVALIIQACIDLQTLSGSRHKDPVHVTSHFLNATVVAPFQIVLQKVKPGKGFTNLSAEFVQDKRMRTTAHLIFGDFSSAADGDEDLVLPASYARQIPLHFHPSTAKTSAHRPGYTFAPRFTQFSTDPEILARNQPNNSKRTTSETIGGGSIEWGSWIELKDKDERVTAPSLAFLADISENLSSLLYGALGKVPYFWYPTLVMTLEFKAPIPKNYNLRTVGAYSSGTFLNNPQGRHDMRTEVWTAPSNLGEGEEQAGWRQEQQCLVISNQMALTVSFDLNKRNKVKL